MLGIFRKRGESRKDVPESVKETIRDFSRKLYFYEMKVAVLGFARRKVLGSIAYLVSVFESITTATEEFSETISSISENLFSIRSSTDELLKRSERVDSKVRKQKELRDEAVKDMEKQIEKLNEFFDEVERIGELTKLISGIAEQTNILALNAAIEAARAGETGRGFAVVAEEVRKLSSKTDELAQNIERLVNELVEGMEKVREGIDRMHVLVSSSADFVADIESMLEANLSMVKEIDGLVASVSTALEEQSSVAREIARRIEEAFEEVKLVQKQADILGKLDL